MTLAEYNATIAAFEAAVDQQATAHPFQAPFWAAVKAAVFSTQMVEQVQQALGTNGVLVIPASASGGRL